jgi:ubiquinone/menaquinone biosynthesis C-methylase UbiE
MKTMATSWERIWSKKTVGNFDKITLRDLILANGYDNGVGSYSEDTWRLMISDLSARTQLLPGKKVLEIGCGSGAVLYALNEIVKIESYGIDYSESLIEVAKVAIPEGNFVAQEADKPCFSETSFDMIFSNGVFFYFPDQEYVKRVIINWTNQISTGGQFVLLDLPDKEYEKVYHQERKKAYKDPAKYEADYKDLRHLFFDKNSVAEFLETIGMRDVRVFPHAVPSYGNARFRFNIICSKP